MGVLNIRRRDRNSSYNECEWGVEWVFARIRMLTRLALK